jgi:hypothetical protein
MAWWRTGSLANAAEYALLLGRLDDAERFARATVESAADTGDRMRTVFALALLADHAAAIGAAARAGTFWGAIEADEARGPIGQWEDLRGEYADRLDPVRGPEFDRGLNEGRRLTLGEAVEYALSLDSP